MLQVDHNLSVLIMNLNVKLEHVTIEMFIVFAKCTLLLKNIKKLWMRIEMRLGLWKRKQKRYKFCLLS